MSDILELKFDPNTIEHLGISLYSKLPSVLSELISNSWDADAETVSIEFIENGRNKEIVYTDNGDGMEFKELQAKYLVIGRNRRKTDGRKKTVKGRKVIGKKGLGKLSVFGICDIVEIITVKNGKLNNFEMDLNKIRKSKDSIYKPNIKAKDKPTKRANCTKIMLKKIRRKSGFNIKNIALSLSKKFLIFDEMKTTLIKKGEKKCSVTNDLKFKELRTEFTWKFPNTKLGSTYKYKNKIKGSILTLKTPVKDTEMRGIFLTSRGKIVNIANFYGARDNDQFHSYVTGYLEVDFIDDFDDDVISTDRHSLNWEHEETKELQEYLQHIIRKIGSEWKTKRSAAKKKKINEQKKIDIEKWQKGLPKFERDLSDKIIDPILENSRIDVDESGQIISNVIDKFDNQVFKEYASRIAEVTEPSQIPTLLSLMEEWKTIEAREMKSLADARIEVIKQFEHYLDTNTKEVPTLHNFLKKFSWLLDPRILEFRDEVTYSNLLKKNYKEKKLAEKDRRIDFLCSNALGEILYVIEIKRSKYKVDYSAIEQAYDYGSFLKEQYASETGFSQVVCYVVGGSKSSNRKFKDKEKTYAQTGEVFVKTYRELLEQSKEYHKEFIDSYNKYNKTNG